MGNCSTSKIGPKSVVDLNENQSIQDTAVLAVADLHDNQSIHVLGEAQQMVTTNDYQRKVSQEKIENSTTKSLDENAEAHFMAVANLLQNQIGEAKLVVTVDNFQRKGSQEKIEKSMSKSLDENTKVIFIFHQYFLLINMLLF